MAEGFRRIVHVDYISEEARDRSLLAMAKVDAYLDFLENSHYRFYDYYRGPVYENAYNECYKLMSELSEEKIAKLRSSIDLFHKYGGKLGMFDDLCEVPKLTIKDAIIKANNMEALETIRINHPRILNIELKSEKNYVCLDIADVAHIFTDKKIVYLEEYFELFDGGDLLVPDCKDAKALLFVVYSSETDLDKLNNYFKRVSEYYNEPMILYGLVVESCIPKGEYCASVIGLE